MHGHPFSGPLQLWWGKTAPPERPRNLFHTLAPGDKPPPADMYRAGGRISLTGRIDDRESLHRQMENWPIGRAWSRNLRRCRVTRRVLCSVHRA